MNPEPQSPNPPSIQGNQQNIPGQVTGPVVGGNVGQIGDIHNNYITQSGERPPLWIDVPSMPNHFVGRDALVSELVASLTAGSGHSASVALSAEGKPGVGKTTLAVALAHHRDVLEHFSDGVLWAGLGPQPDLPSRLARWADALGVDVSDRPTVAARSQAVRDAIGQRRLLLVIDDAWQSEAAQQLRVGGPHCAHLLTSRDQSLAFAFAGRSRPVAELDPADALELLRRLAPKAVAVDEAQAAALLAAVGYLPLAVELLGGYLAAGARGRFAQASRAALAELTDPARRLALASRRLGAPPEPVEGQVPRVTLQETIALSIDGLAEESPGAVELFYALGAFAPKPASFDLAAALAVAAHVGDADADGTAGADALALLIERNLLEQDERDDPVLDGPLALHQTIADVARTRTPAGAITRHREHYLARVNADRDDWQAIEGFYPQIQWAWQRTPPDDSATVEFVDSLYTYLSRRGLWEDYLNWLAAALASTEQNEDAKSQARMLVNYGYVYDALGEKGKALGYYEEALPLRRQVGDRSGEATTLTNIGAVYSALGEKEKALGYYEEALPLSRQVGDRRGEATTLNNIGAVYSALGEKEKALGYYDEALPLSRQVGDRSGEATTLNNIGRVYDDLGEKEKALGYYEEALPLDRQVGDRSGEATTLNNIGGVYDDLGEKEKALGYYEEALPLIRQVGDRSGEATTLNNIGGVYRSLGEMEKALGYYAEALPLRRQVGDRGGEATTLNNIGRVYSALGEKEKALGYYEEALPLIRQVGDRSGEAMTLNNIGAVYSALGEKEKALGYYDEALPLSRQVGDRRGEATTLNNIGLVYRSLGEMEKALGYCAEALPLFRQVGDRFGESVTRFNMAMVFVGEGRLAEAEEQMEIVVQIDEAVRHPDLESDHRELERVRAMRRGAQ